MTNEKILEIARRYTAPVEESSLLVEFNEHDVPTPTGETMSMETWSFCEEELLAFAQSVIEAERERIKRIMEQVGAQGNHDKWFDCADAIMERIG